MKNVMKKVFSLLLVGVVSVSMFGFIAPTRAEATGDDFKGVVKLRNHINYKTKITVCFFKNHSDTSPSRYTKNFSKGGQASIQIPQDTEIVEIYVECDSICRSISYESGKTFGENPESSDSFIFISCVPQFEYPKYEFKSSEDWFSFDDLIFS